MTEWTERSGFGSPMAEKIVAERRRRGVELFATLALAASLFVAATAVSIGVARAQAGYAARPVAATSVAAFLGAMMAGKIH